MDNREQFHQGTSIRAYEVFGAHSYVNGSEEGYVFRVWAPNATKVFVTGDWNDWYATNPMTKVTDEGIWEAFVPQIKQFADYKYLIEDKEGDRRYKADPYGFHAETRPKTASKTFDIDGYKWTDSEWIVKREKTLPYNKAMNIYEVHFGSWRKYEDGNYFSYNKMADELIPYVKDMGYTHIELMPISEYPYDGSWGYQITGYYAASSRYGTPTDFMEFVDRCHESGIGVILDWVPGHFPKDEAGLYQFDGTPCYEYSDPLKSEHKDWGTMVFDWGRNEVKSFLISNAVFWIEKFHIDGLRVDAVASMLYLDYGRENGQWRPNIYGGHENLEAIQFLKDLNAAVFSQFENVLMIAEESTAWPLVTKPIENGGLGFNFKWNMGWMNDTLLYMKQDPLFRKGCHNNLTFAMTYIYSENFILPLSHDEVVHMKGSLINKMPGEYEAKFANLRAYMGYMIGHPGKKLLFMGGEIAQFDEWHYESELTWELLNYPIHKKFKEYIKEINHMYLDYSQLWEIEDSWEGFKWVSADDCDHNILAYRRFDKNGNEILVISNFSPVNYKNYIFGLDKKLHYKKILSSEEIKYGGVGFSKRTINTIKKECKGLPYTIKTDIPGYSTTFWLMDKEG